MPPYIHNFPPKQIVDVKHNYPIEIVGYICIKLILISYAVYGKMYSYKSTYLYKYFSEGDIMSETKTKQSVKLRYLVLSGVLAALVFVFTAYLHIPSGNGYTHAGDGVIYLAACILPTPYAIAVGVIGGALADGLSGFPIWIPATVLVKAVTALFFTQKSEKIVTLRNIFGIVPSLITCIIGYSVYEALVIANGVSKAGFIAAFQQIPAYCIQILVSSALFILVGLALDKTGFKKSLLK